MPTPKKFRASIKDVAKEAGVSIATVSRIVNSVDYPVSDELRDRVHQVIKRLHYQPCFSAQSLRTRTTSAIGLLVRDIADPYFSSIAKGVTERALGLSLMPLVCSTNRDPDLEVRYLQLLSQYQVAGIVLAGAGWREPEHLQAMSAEIDTLFEQGIRVVACSPHAISIPTITVDNEALGAAAYENLWNRGHRSFVVLGGQEHNLSSYQRVQGFVRTHQGHGLPSSACVVLHQASYNRRESYAAGCEAAHLAGCTAMFCITDSLAIGALRGLADNGVEVPHQMSLISVGDTETAAFSTPALTTFRISLDTIGARAVDLIMEKKEPDRTYVRHAPFELVERESLSCCCAD